MSELSAVAPRERETPDIETASDGYARRFAGPAGRYLLDEQARAVREALGSWRGGRVLDVGGGHAQLVPLFLERDWEIVVVGSSDASLERVRRDYPACGAVTGDLLDLPFPAASFDLVIAVRLISHIERWQQLVTELCRVARYSVIIDYPRTVGFNALTPLLFPLKKRFEGNTRTYHNFRDRELDRAFRSAGFEPRIRRPQLLLPMVAHRRLSAAPGLHAFESAARTIGLTAMLGSPVILRADRTGEA